MHSFRSQRRVTGSGITIQDDVLLAWPDRVHTESRLEKTRMVSIVTPGVGYVSSNFDVGLTVELNAQERQAHLDYAFKGNVFFIAQHAGDPRFSFSLGGTQMVGGIETRIIEVNADGLPLRWFVDPQSGRILRQSGSFQGKNSETDYSDWRDVGEFTIPFHWTSTDGKDSYSTEILAIEINPPVDAALFGRPAAALGPITPAAARPALPKAVLKVASQPPNAQVFLDDRPRGATDAEGNLVLRAAAGAHRLKLTFPGHKDSVQDVTLAVGNPTKVEARLVPPTASLQVQTQPGVVQVYVDDELKGVSSSEGRLVINKLAPGNHRVRLTLIGYKEAIQPLELAAGDSKTIEAKLEAAGPKPLALAEIEEALTNGLPPKGITKLVNQYGVDFALTDEAEKRLRAAGADDGLLLAISRNKK
jgi:hypothetical protein